ncbi:UDP-N-acetylglucosamine 4,6-dehydratase (inverting) [Desulfovibrionales bacterium]
MLNGKTILITGGTGSFGRQCTQMILNRYNPKRLIIFSRDELKQFEMAQQFPRKDYPVRFFIGDVRDKERLSRAFQKVDIVIHAAAMKQVPTAEYNPTECIKTNVYGAENIINVAADRRVSKVLALSTDKAVSPVNLYGATKLCAEKLFVAANQYVTLDQTQFSICRYGNVIASRGSVIPLFLNLRKTGRIPITDTRMTRFWITLEQGVNFVLQCLARMNGGEVYVPKIPSMNIMDLAKSLCPECEIDIIGIRPGEKLHEVMVSVDDAHRTLEFDDHFLILPSFTTLDFRFKDLCGKPVSERFEYNSGTNDHWLSTNELVKLAGVIPSDSLRPAVD